MAPKIQVPMDSKASAPPQGIYPSANIPDAPPSYEASISQPNYGPPGASAMPPGIEGPFNDL